MGNIKVRESNIELLRNISMFMILVIHANFVSLPRIGYEELLSNIVPSITRFFFESLGIVAVNVFVFISGWFGIKTRTKSVLSFIYLILFYLLGGGILFLLLGKSQFSISGLLDIFQLSAKDWFIKSYFVLMIVAPVLNTFSKEAEEKTQRYVVLSFFLFEAIYGWATGGKRFFVDGYGPLHFIGLYLSAQYIHYHSLRETAPIFIKKIFTMPRLADLCVFFITVFLNTSLVVSGVIFTKGSESIHGIIYAYSNPITVIGALYLLLFFSKIKIPYVKAINWLGASSFAVYLFHGENTVRNKFFTPQVQYLYNAYSGVLCIIMIFIFLLIVYMFSVIIDQLRIITWNKFCLVFIGNEVEKKE